MASNLVASSNKRKREESSVLQSAGELFSSDVYPPVRIRLAACYRDAPTPLSVEVSDTTNSDNTGSVAPVDVIIIVDDDDDDEDDNDGNSISSGNSSGTEYVPDDDEWSSSGDEY